MSNADLEEFLRKLMLPEVDFTNCKRILGSEMVSRSQILNSSVTMDDLREIGISESVLEAMQEGIDECRREENERLGRLKGFSRAHLTDR